MPKIPDSVKKKPLKGFPVCKQCKIHAVYHKSTKGLCFWCEYPKEKR